MNKAREEQVVALCREMIQQRSYSGEEAGVVKVLSAHMEKMGFDEVTVDTYGNIIGCIKGKAVSALCRRNPRRKDLRPGNQRHEGRGSGPGYVTGRL